MFGSAAYKAANWIASSDRIWLTRAFGGARHSTAWPICSHWRGEKKHLFGMKTAAFHRITNAITSDDEQKLFLIDAPYDACSCVVALLQRNYKNNMAITHSHWSVVKIIMFRQHAMLMLTHCTYIYLSRNGVRAYVKFHKSLWVLS